MDEAKHSMNTLFEQEGQRAKAELGTERVAELDEWAREAGNALNNYRPSVARTALLQLASGVNPLDVVWSMFIAGAVYYQEYLDRQATPEAFTKE